MIGSGFSRIPYDEYETIDGRLVAQLSRSFDLRGIRVWEPACGRHGYLVHALRAAGARIVALGDLQTGQDFFALRPKPGAVEAIITNPPFSDLSRFIEHALAVLPDGWVIMLARWDWLGAIGTRSGKRELVDCHPRFFALTIPQFRPWWSHEQSETPRHAFTWLVWSPEGRPSVPRIWRD